ncbi:hypothetical protein BGZ94_006813, partial [Podila epigama]
MFCILTAFVTNFDERDYYKNKSMTDPVASWVGPNGIIYPTMPRPLTTTPTPTTAVVQPMPSSTFG